MSTNLKKVNIYLKKFLTQQQITENFLDFLQTLILESFSKVWQSNGVFEPNPSITQILSSDTINTFDIITPLVGTDGEPGHILNLDSIDSNNIPFENATGIVYHVGLRFQEVPNETEINVRTGEIKYTFFQERIGELADPDAVVDDADETLTITVDSIFEAGVSSAGRKVLVYLKDPVSQADTFEEVTVIFSGGLNKIETLTSLGQPLGFISVDPTDYEIFAIGSTVRRNTDLRLDPDIMYIGNMTGDLGASPSVFDQTDVNNLSFGLVGLISLFDVQHSLVDGTHKDITALSAIVSGDVRTGSGAEYSKVSDLSVIPVDGSLNEVFDETLDRKLLKITSNNPADKIINISASSTTLADGSKYILPNGVSISAYIGGTLNMETGAFTGQTILPFTKADFTGRADKFFKYSLNLLESNEILVLSKDTTNGANYGATEILTPNAPISPVGIPFAQIIVQNDSGVSVTAIRAVDEGNFERIGAGAGVVTGAFQEPLGIGDGANKNFPLAIAPVDEKAVIIFSNIAAFVDSEWNLNVGLNRIEFVTAPALGVDVYAYYLTTGSTIAVPPGGQQQVLYRTITAGEFAAKQLTLPVIPLSAAKVVVDVITGSSQEFAVDFTVSGTTLDWNGLGLEIVVIIGTRLRIIYF